VVTATQDIHSGEGGSIIPNAAWRLVWALNTLKSEDERINLPGFYDDVISPSEQDIAFMAALPAKAEEVQRVYGFRSFLNRMTDEVEIKIAEVFQPTCTICGLTSGYQGEGSKTIMPSRASAKIDFRLVPKQTPEKVLEQLRKHLDSEGFSDVEIEYLGGEAPARTDPTDPFVDIVVQAASEPYGKEMLIVPMLGGSGPNHLFVNELGLPVVTAGIGYPGSQIHSPNENIRLDLYLKGSKHIARILTLFGKD
jgi:acetylornithine deacetylase/succinyl-diaminopimelate desuccinylase-like protein